MNPAIETELKLSVAPEAIRRLQRHPLLRRGARMGRWRLYSVYFDTPAFDLWRQGIAFRLRREGGRWLQTVKGGGSVEAGLHRRFESEAEVRGPQPDWSRIGDGAVAEIFASPELRAQLAPVFVTDFSRSSRRIEIDAGVVVEVSIDRGAIKYGDMLQPVTELELELKSGPAWPLFDFALQLLDAVPLRIENRSKAERGYALARGARPMPVKTGPVHLAADATTGAAFKAIAWAALNHLLANEEGMLQGADPEYLHQVRVALRRLRSAFGVFAALLPVETTEPLKAEFKWLAAALGPARDWDVFMTETLPPIREAFAGHAGLARFARACGGRRRAGNRKARRAVGSSRYERLMLEFAAWLAAERWARQADGPALAAWAEPAGSFAAGVLDQRFKRVRKRGRKLARRSTAELHRLRIAVKKLRYPVDFFSTLFEPKPVREMVARLSRLQNILGAMNDAATVERLLDEALRARTDRALSEARGIVAGWNHGRALALRRELRPAWKAFRVVEKFW